MLRAGADCRFAIRNPSEAVRRLVWGSGFELIELPEITNLIEEATALPKSEIVILDGYHFDHRYQSQVRQSGAFVVCIDDIPERHFTADLVINHNGTFTAADYSAEAHTTFAIGPKYALLRGPFRNAAYVDPTTRLEGHIFVCLGGADPKNDTLAVLEHCATVDSIKRVELVVGSAYSHSDALLDWLITTPISVEIHTNLSATSMQKLMSTCPTAVCSASTTAFEYASVGGALHLIQIADNQAAIYEFFIQRNLALPIEVLGKATFRQKQKLHRKQRICFDGRSAERLQKII